MAPVSQASAEKRGATIFYRIADITLRISADLPITRETFAHKIAPFQVTAPGDDCVNITHHFSLPDMGQFTDLAPSYQHPPWTITRVGDSWVYDGNYPTRSGGNWHFLHAEWAQDYATGHIYHDSDARWKRGGLEALSLTTTDQILLTRLLADRQGCLLHSAGMNLWGKGFLFIGHSSAGKSTTVTMLREHGTILCDDRIAVRRVGEDYGIYGTWSHGTVSEISPSSAPLHALCFIEQAERNAIIPLTDRREILGRLLPCVIKSFITADWWQKTLAMVDDLIGRVPAYRLLRDMSGRVVDVLHDL